LVGVELHGRRLADEVETRGPPVALLASPCYAAQRAGFDAHAQRLPICLRRCRYNRLTRQANMLRLSRARKPPLRTASARQKTPVPHAIGSFSLVENHVSKMTNNVPKHNSRYPRFRGELIA